MNWNQLLDSGGVLVSERVLLEFEISAVKDAEDAKDSKALATAGTAFHTH